MPKYIKEIEPHFLFIITPPYSGSTALAKLLNTSNRTMLLHKKGEGQWLIPGLCSSDRWEADKNVNYESIRAVWLHSYQKRKKSDECIDVVIEKSPPNMVRIERLAAMFGSVSFIANNRSPYASCASILYRRYNGSKIGEEERLKILGELVETWLKRSYRIKEIVEQFNIPLVTYEHFCDDPSSIKQALSTPEGVADSINPNANVKVKDYKAQKIMNMNERQISLLTGKERDYLTAILANHDEMMNYYKYTTLELTE